MEAAREMVHDQDLPMHLWEEVARIIAVYVHWTAKYSEMTDFCFLAEKHYFRCPILEHSMWITVLYIHNYRGNFFP